MNSLLVFPEEIKDKLASIRGEHLNYVRELHELEVGMNIQVGIVGGNKGRGVVISIDNSEITIELSCQSPPLAREAINLIVAVPRPQTQKKVLQLAATFGIESLHFVRSQNTEKSYLSSHSLEPKNQLWELLRGLEQTGDTILPNVVIHDRFRPFMEDTLLKTQEINQSKKFLLETIAFEANANFAKIDSIDPSAKVTMAIGPEAGWNDFERELFIKSGFEPISLGKRIYRCETAVSVSLAQIQLLRERYVRSLKD